LEDHAARPGSKISGAPVIHQPLVFPDSDVEIHFDIEDDPTQDFVYLHGILLAQKGMAPQYHAFFAESRDYEKTTLKRLIQKHKLDSAVYNRLFGDKRR
jgi:predicted RecB family nuclease